MQVELIVGDAVLVVDGALGVDADIAVVVDAVVGHGPGAAPVRVLQDLADHAEAARVHGAGVLGVDPEDLLHLAVEEEVEGGIVPDAAEVPLGVDEVAPAPLLEQGDDPLPRERCGHRRVGGDGCCRAGLGVRIGLA